MADAPRKNWLTGRTALLIVFAVALLVRLLYLSSTLDSPLFRTFQLDTRWHAEWAAEIASGQLTSDHPFFRAPLYPYFLAAAYKLSGDSFTGARIIQHILGALSCVVVVAIGRRIFGAAAAFIAGMICALYGPLIYFENELLIPSVAILLFLLALWRNCCTAERPSWHGWLVTGLLYGLCAITRPNFLIIIAVVASRSLWPSRTQSTWRRQATAAALLLVGALAPILPVTLYNRIYGNDWVLIASQGGVNFFIGNHAQSNGKTSVAYAPPVWREPPGYVDNVWWSSKLWAEHDLGRPLRDSEVSAFWYERAWDFWRASPGQALALTLRKAYYFLNGFELESNRSLYLDRLYSPIAAALMWELPYGPAFPLGIVLPLALVGMCIPAEHRRLAWLLRWCTVAYALTVIAFFVTGRFRMPVIPLFALFAGHALVQFCHAWRSKRRPFVRRAAFGFIALAVFCNSTLYGVREIEYDRQADVLGVAHQRLGDYENALRYFEEATRANPHDFSHWDKYGRAAWQLGRYGEAETAYRKAIELLPRMGSAYTRLGGVLLAEDKPKEAADVLLQALQFDDQQGPAHALLAELYAHTGQPELAADHVKLAEDAGFVVDPARLTTTRPATQP